MHCCFCDEESWEGLEEPGLVRGSSLCLESPRPLVQPPLGLPTPPSRPLLQLTVFLDFLLPPPPSKPWHNNYRAALRTAQQHRRTASLQRQLVQCARVAASRDTRGSVVGGGCPARWSCHRWVGGMQQQQQQPRRSALQLWQWWGSKGRTTNKSESRWIKEPPTRGDAARGKGETCPFPPIRLAKILMSWTFMNFGVL